MKECCGLGVYADDFADCFHYKIRNVFSNLIIPPIKDLYLFPVKALIFKVQHIKRKEKFE